MTHVTYPIGLTMLYEIPLVDTGKIILQSVKSTCTYVTYHQQCNVLRGYNKCTMFHMYLFYYGRALTSHVGSVTKQRCEDIKICKSLGVNIKMKTEKKRF